MSIVNLISDTHDDFIGSDKRGKNENRRRQEQKQKY